jgi:F0F1-type ATP synthase membrane subunit b/b'
MEVIATSTISVIDLINLSKDVAQLNLGYLGVSVAILGVLGGVFIYFNIKPLKDTLDKQEKTIEDLKKEAYSLLSQSGEQTDKTLSNFRSEQSVALSSVLKQQKETVDLEVANKIKESESFLIEKIESVSDNKDTKLKETILSEVTNRLAVLEKNLTSALGASKGDSDKRFLQVDQSISGLKSNVKDAQRDIKELKVYKFSQEDKMGAIIYSIELLKEDIDENRWSILNSLERLQGEIDGKVVEPEYVAKIEEQLARLKDSPKYNVIIKAIRKKYSEEKEA